MELEIVKFIKSHENWEELLAAPPYSLNIKRDGKLILFKYNQLESDFHEKIVCESRGIILEEGTWKVVRLAFYKFFNVGEECASPIDWESSIASEKIDGSLMSAFFYDGKWRLATNGTIDAFSTEMPVDLFPSKQPTFGEVFNTLLPLDAFERYGLDKNMCYTFELTSPFNQVVIRFKTASLHLLSVRDLSKDGYPELENPQDAVNKDMITEYDIHIPKTYKLHSLEDYKELVSSMGDENDVKEGIVVRDKYFNRVKLKTLKYLELHYKYASSTITLDKVIRFILDHETSEFLAYYPDYENDVIRIEKRMNNIKVLAKVADELDFYFMYSHEYETDLTEEAYNALSEKEKRKMYAEYISRHDGSGSIPYYKTIMFKGWDKRAVKTVESWGVTQWSKYIKMCMDDAKNND